MEEDTEAGDIYYEATLRLIAMNLKRIKRMAEEGKDVSSETEELIETLERVCKPRARLEQEGVIPAKRLE